MKDLTRSYVNISPKGQKKVHGVFTRIPKRTTGVRQAAHGPRNTGGELERKIQGDEQVGNKKQIAQTDHVRKPRTNAGFGII